MPAALLAAIGASIGYGAASVLEAVAARRRSGAGVYAQPLYLAGLGLDLLSWLASLLALQRLTLFTVQALLAGSLVVTMLLARAVFGTRLTGDQVAAMLVLSGALAVIALATGEQPVSAAPGYFNAVLLGLLLVLLLALVLAYGRRQPLVLAIVAGLAASAAALGARSMRLSGTPGEILLQPVLWIVAGCGVVTMVAYTRALEDGAVGPLTAVFTVIEVVVPGTVGMLLLDDVVRPGWEAYKFIAIALSLLAGVWLALSGGADPGAAAVRVSGRSASRPRVAGRHELPRDRRD